MQYLELNQIEIDQKQESKASNNYKYAFNSNSQTISFDISLVL